MGFISSWILASWLNILAVISLWWSAVFIRSRIFTIRKVWFYLSNCWRTISFNVTAMFLFMMFYFCRYGSYSFRENCLLEIFERNHHYCNIIQRSFDKCFSHYLFYTMSRMLMNIFTFVSIRAIPHTLYNFSTCQFIKYTITYENYFFY